MLKKPPEIPKDLICDDRQGAIRKYKKWTENTQAPETEDLFSGN
jgi:hypothetical protein